MKRKPILLIAVIAFALCLLCGCGGDKEIVSKTPLDTRYTAERHELVTYYHYKYNVLGGGFQIVPEVRSETVPEKYEVYYHVIFVDGTTSDRWETTNKTEYEQVEESLKKE